jgi:hypothetical protein
MNAFLGHLAAESPLRAIFANGFVPLAGPQSTMAKLGEPPHTQMTRVYMVDVKVCSAEQKEGIAQLMHRMGQGTIDEARSAIATNEPIPIREQNLNGVSFPLRYVT